MAYGKNISAIRQSGLSSCKSCSRGSFSNWVAFNNEKNMPGEVMDSTFSHPSSKSTSAPGNLMVFMSIQTVADFDFTIVLEIIGSLHGVVIMVAFTPLEANSLAISTIGIMWPGAKNGKKYM